MALAVTVKGDYGNVVVLPGGQAVEAGQTAILSDEQFLSMRSGLSDELFSEVAVVDMNDYLITPQE